MANLSIGIVKDKTTGQVVHEHFTENADDTFHVDIWNEDEAVIVGEFRKFYHLEKLVKEEYPNLETIRHDAGDVSAEWLMNVLKR